MGCPPLKVVIFFHSHYVLGRKYTFYLFGENYLGGHGMGWAQYLLCGCLGKITLVATVWGGHNTCFMDVRGKLPWWPRRGVGTILALWLFGENFSTSQKALPLLLRRAATARHFVSAGCPAFAGYQHFAKGFAVSKLTAKPFPRSAARLNARACFQ